MSGEEALDTLILELKRTNRAAFLQAHPYPFLLSERMPATDNDWDFRTDTVERPATTAQSEDDIAAISRGADLRVMRVLKSSNNPWRGRISIGRASNNDLVLSSPSISKLHAHFNETADGSFSITDARSKNGTKLNGKRLEPGEPALLDGGDQLEIGKLRMTFHSCTTFADLLQKLIDG